MNNKFLLAILLASVTTSANAQLRGFADKVKNKVVQKATQRADSKIDKEIDKTLDEIEGKGTSTNNSGSEGKSESSGGSKSGKSLKSNSKFDFIPGDSILFSEDFSQDVIGEMPLGWNSTGKSEIVTLDNIPGKWMKLYQNSVYISSNKSAFPKNFTLEFDLILQLTNNGYTYPLMKFGIFSSSDEESHDNKFLEKYKDYQWVDMMIRPSATTSSYMHLQTHMDRQAHFKGTDQQLSDLYNSYNTRSVHIAMQGQGARLRVWINQDKIYDIPQALPDTYNFNQIFFNMGSASFKEDEPHFYITNLKLATGVPDTRHKLIEEGKLSTTAILFDVNTANLKTESFGIIKEIGTVLKQNEDVKISIIGHTDSDGKDDANLTLSEKRAAAVKEALVKEYGIEEGRIQTSGKGESQPLGDNKTKEGKAQNRRVEFIKL